MLKSSQELETVVDIVVSAARNEILEKEVVTKRDLENTKLELQKEMEVIRKEIAESRFATLKFIIWTNVSVVLFLTGIMARGFHWI